MALFVAACAPLSCRRRVRDCHDRPHCPRTANFLLDNVFFLTWAVLWRSRRQVPSEITQITTWKNRRRELLNAHRQATQAQKTLPSTEEIPRVHTEEHQQQRHSIETSERCVTLRRQLAQPRKMLPSRSWPERRVTHMSFVVRRPYRCPSLELEPGILQNIPTEEYTVNTSNEGRTSLVRFCGCLSNRKRQTGRAKWTATTSCCSSNAAIVTRRLLNTTIHLYKQKSGTSHHIKSPKSKKTTTDMCPAFNLTVEIHTAENGHVQKEVN